MKISNISCLIPGKSWPYHQPIYQQSDLDTSSFCVSVIIPSFNQSKYLEAAIRSVLCQDYPNVECLVLDGGSTDGSDRIIEHYRGALAFAKCEKDNGQAAAVNEGVRHARGDIMSFLNSDDMLAPGAITQVVNAFKLHPESMLVHGHRILIDAEDNVAGWTSSPPFDPKVTPYTINSETSFWRKSAFNHLRGFNESLSFSLDLDFFCRLYVQFPIHQVDAFLGYYRFHPLSKSETMNDVQYREARLCWQQIFGCPFPERKQSTSIPSRIQHGVTALKNMRLVFIPYIKHKLSTTIK